MTELNRRTLPAWVVPGGYAPAYETWAVPDTGPMVFVAGTVTPCCWRGWLVEVSWVEDTQEAMWCTTYDKGWVVHRLTLRAALKKAAELAERKVDELEGRT